MREVPEHIDALIARIITGDTESQDQSELDAWLKESPENLQYFEESKKIFQAVEFHKFQKDYNAENALRKVNSRIDKPEGRIISLFSRGNMIRAAASFLLLITLGYMMYRVMYDQPAEAVQYAALNTPVENKLPDG